jgi:hypothetical protein
MASRKGALKWWRKVLDEHEHQWERTGARPEWQVETYACYCGLSYVHMPGSLTHFAPHWLVIRRLPLRNAPDAGRQ